MQTSGSRWYESQCESSAYTFLKLQISAPNTYVCGFGTKNWCRTILVSLVSFPLVPSPEHLRGLQCTPFSGCLTFYFISLSSFLLPESDQEQLHKLTPVMQMSLGRQESLGSTPQQWIRESSTVQLSFLVTQKASWFRNNPSSSFISSSLLSAMYLDKVDFWLLLIKDKLTLIWIIFYFIWIPSIWSWEFPGIPLKYAFCCS